MESLCGVRVESEEVASLPYMVVTVSKNSSPDSRVYDDEGLVMRKYVVSWRD